MEESSFPSHFSPRHLILRSRDLIPCSSFISQFIYLYISAFAHELLSPPHHNLLSSSHAYHTYSTLNSPASTIFSCRGRRLGDQGSEKPHTPPSASAEEFLDPLVQANVHGTPTIPSMHSPVSLGIKARKE